MEQDIVIEAKDTAIVVKQSAPSTTPYYLDSTGIVRLTYDSIHAVTFNDMFGNQAAPIKTITNLESHQEYNKPSELNQWVNYSLFLAIFIIYSVVISRFSTTINTLYRATVNTIYLEKFIVEQSVNVKIFFNLSSVLKVLIAIIAVTTIIDLLGINVPDILGVNHEFVIPIATIVALFTISLYKNLMITIISILTLNHAFTRGLQVLQRVSEATGAMLLTPLIYVSIFAVDQFTMVSYYMAALVLLLIVINYIFRSYRYFIHENVSALQWFLYLCSVEILPLSFIVIFILKYHP